MSVSSHLLVVVIGMKTSIAVADQDASVDR